MRRITALAILAAAVLALPDTKPVRAGTEVTVKVPVVDGLKFSLGIRIDKWSVSMDGILFLEGDEQQKLQENVGDRSRRTLHEVRLGEACNFFAISRDCYLAARAMQQTARRITEHWLAEKSSRPDQSKDSEHADSR